LRIILLNAYKTTNQKTTSPIKENVTSVGQSSGHKNLIAYKNLTYGISTDAEKISIVDKAG
jgi:hypothetical protein